MVSVGGQSILARAAASSSIFGGLSRRSAYIGLVSGRALFSSERPDPMELAGRTAAAIKEYLQMRREEVAVEQQTEKGGEAAKSVAEEALRKLDDNINTFNTKTPEELLMISFESLGFDGLEEVECLLQIEETFDVKLPDEAFNTLKNGQQAMEAVIQQLKEKEKEE